MWQFHLDEQIKGIFVRVEGLMTPDEVDQFNDEMEQLVQQARARFGTLRILTDASKAMVQPAESAARFRLPGAMLTSALDRYAVVVLTSLGRIQARRILPDKRVGIFIEMTEARAWLQP